MSSQDDRIRRIKEVNSFAVIDNDMDSLLRQVEAIAGCIRYYGLNNMPDGYFDQFLQDLSKIREQNAEKFMADGNIEPAQALLFTFLHQLHDITQHFNQRWENFFVWYFTQLLGIKPIKPKKHKLCMAFTKNTNQTITIKKDTKFIFENSSQLSLTYRLPDNLTIENISIGKAFSIYFNKPKETLPASEFVTLLKVKDLLHTGSQNDFLFNEDRNMKNNRTLGFIISSSALLLKEGRRTAVLTFIPESNEWTKWLDKINDDVANDAMNHRIFNNIFYVRISCQNGWEIIENYSVKSEDGKLILKFTLLENFPATSECTAETHAFESSFPSLKIYLNFDAWLYPYTWMKDILLQKIHIKTTVSGISNVSVYNELGQVDCSKPFSPFGINTEKGAWMVIGNYEMAAKNTLRASVKLNWGQLPADSGGLQEYYSNYGKNIDNRSFTLQAQYLSDYQWKEIQAFFLFSTVPAAADGSPVEAATLSKECIFHNIGIEKMPRITIPEEEYSYNIHAKTGFIGFVLQSPGIGFGEKYYRTLLMDYLTQFAGKKQRKQPAPNQPISPVLERITLDYEAEDTIDLRIQSAQERNTFYHVSPFGTHKVYPNHENNPVPIIFTMDTEANIVVELNHVKRDKILSLYIDFEAVKKEITSLSQLPDVKWYLGNGYKWQRIPDGYIVEDKTESLLVSGFLKIYMPENIEASLFTAEKTLFLRAGIEKQAQSISPIKNIYVNTAEIILDTDISALPDDFDGEILTGTWKPDENIPGLDQIFPIAFYGRHKKETTEELLLRVSEYVTHKGRAISARDFERITLQAFPEIGKVKCLSGFNAKSTEKNTVTLVVIPQKTRQDNAGNWRPLANSRQILDIEEYFLPRISATINAIDVINPCYEEIMIRCKVDFKKRFSGAACRTRLVEMLNGLIAPWLQNVELPEFDQNLSVETIYQAIFAQKFVETIHHLSVVRIGEIEDKKFRIDEYKNRKDTVKPSKSFAVFVPAKEHIIRTGSESFGLNEMELEETFIVS